MLIRRHKKYIKSNSYLVQQRNKTAAAVKTFKSCKNLTDIIIKVSTIEDSIMKAAQLSNSLICYLNWTGPGLCENCIALLAKLRQGLSFQYRCARI